MSIFDRKKRNDPDPSPDLFELGPLEAEVMQILWTRGECSVRDVVQELRRPLAYTTVMTTLDRLFKKRLLKRQKLDRAFVYAPALTHTNWEQTRADAWLSGFLSGPQSSGELLISCLLDVVGKHDQTLLAELERQISLKRRELESKGLHRREQAAGEGQ